MKYLLVIILLSSSLAFGQWQHGGNVVGYYSPYTDPFGVADVGDGKTLIVWDKSIGGDYDIVAQYVDSDGYSYWGTEGMIVYEDDGIRQDYPAVLADGEGGAYIVWSDWRHESEYGVELYGQHIDGEGNMLWPAAGKRLTYDTLYTRKPQIFIDGNDGIILVYNRSYDIGAQRIDLDGEILWDSSGINIVTAPYDQSYPRVAKVSDTEFTLCWIDDRYISGDSSYYGTDIYMQKINIHGQTLWDENGIPAVHYQGSQGYLWGGHDIVEDGQGGIVVVWTEIRRITYNRILFADRFSPEGESMWEENGQALGDDTVDQGRECEVYKIGNNFMFRWGGVGPFRVSYLNHNGVPIWDGVVPLDSLTPFGKVIMEPVGVFMFEGDYMSSKVDTSGYQYWPNRPYAWDYDNHLTLLPDGEGGLINVWGYALNRQVKISRIYENGRVAGDTLTSINEDHLTENYHLNISNYPNPFNTSTIISFKLPEPGHVSLDIYDILGRKVTSLLNQSMTICRHNILFEADNLSTGMYFYRLSTGSTTQSGSMTVVK